MKNKSINIHSFIRERILILIMRTFIFLLCSTVFGFTSVNSFSQDKVIIDADKEVTVHEVFRIIKEQTKYRFLYPEDLFKDAPKVQLKKGVILVSKLLEASFSSSNVKFNITENNTILIEEKSTPVIANIIEKKQTHQIGGTVKDSKGQPVLGANILEKGTDNGTQTDVDGKFTLNVADEDAILVVTFIGYVTKEVALNGKTNLSIRLVEDTAELEEIVLIGYGEKKRETLTSSVAQIQGEETKESPTVNLTSSLQGRLPGLMINQRTSDPGREEFSILVRGQSTYGDNSALVVIDGVVGRDGLSRLDPQDIASISVIKDASASIYGARAANGVILVTTKRGKKSKAKVTLRASTAISSPTTVVKGVTPYNYGRQINAIRQRAGQEALYSPAELQGFQSLNAIDFWKELFDQTSTQNRYSVSVQGGGDSVSYYASLGYVDQSPIVNHDEITNFKQYNIRSNIDYKIKDGLKIGLDLAGRAENISSPPYLFQAVDNASKTLPLNTEYIKDGKFIQLKEKQYNIFGYLQKRAGYSNSKNNLFNATLRLNYEIPKVKGLSFGAWLAADNWINDGNSYVNKPVQYIVQDDETLKEDIQGGNTSVTNSFSSTVSITQNANLEYKGSFHNHNIETYVAVEQNTVDSKSSSLSRKDGLISESLPYLNQGVLDGQTTNSTLSESARLAYLGRLSYDYDEKYLATFGFRYDGSYIFPEGKRFGFFPYVSAGWIATKETFLTDIKGLDFFKLRGTWGKIGNDRVAAFQYLQNISNAGGVFPFTTGNEITLSPTGVDPNPNITWETATTWEMGFESRFYLNKIGFEMTYFSEERDNILSKRNVTIPKYTGLNPPSENIGKTKNSGYEVVLSYSDKIGPVNIVVGGNIAYNKNELVFRDDPEPEEPYQKLEGRPIGSKLVYNAVGIFRTQAQIDSTPSRDGTQVGDLIYADTNKDGKIDTKDRIVQEESTLPRMQYGINFKVSYKGLELSTFWQGQTGSVLPLASFLSAGVSSANYFAENAYTPETPNAISPSIGGTKSAFNGYNNYENNFFTYSTSYIRLKNIQLSYHLPDRLLKYINFSGVNVYVSASNLLTFSSFNDLNFADVEQTNGLGYQRPLRKVFNFGIELTF